MSLVSEPRRPTRGMRTGSVQLLQGTSEAGVAALLLRLLGIYFTVWAILSGMCNAMRVWPALARFGFDDLLSWMVALYAAPFAVGLIIGVYFLIGGQWVFDRLLAPVAPRPLADGPTDTEANDDRPGADNPPSTNTE